MANLRSYDDFVSRVMSGYDAHELVYGDRQSTITSALFSVQGGSISDVASIYALPSLPAGVTAYIITSLDMFSPRGTPLGVAKAINLGSIDLSTNIFTAGSAMPSLTEGGVSNQAYSMVLAEVTTALNSTPGALKVTYNANDGTTGNNTAVTNLTASATQYCCGFVSLAVPHWGASQVTNAVQSGGTTPTGVITFWGLLPICMISQGFNSSTPAFRNLLSATLNPFRLGAGDQLKFFSFYNNIASAVTGTLNTVGDS